MKRVLSILLAIFLCINLTAPSNAYAATTKINKSKLVLRTGDTYSLKLNGVSGDIQWSSSKDTIATVTTAGKVKAVKPGKSTIEAVYQGKTYQCAVTVKSSKTVDVVYTAYIFDDSTIKQYAKQYKKENPDVLDVKVYDDEHITVTMYETDRLDALKEYNDSFDELLQSIITDDTYEGIFTDIEADNLLTNVKLYANKDKYDGSLAELGIVLTFGIVGEAVQAMNLIDVKDRACTISIIDNVTGETLYTTE